MKILLDEQLPVKLKFRLIPQFEVSTVKDEKWLGIKNGDLIKLMLNAGFEVFITNDQSLGFQQKLGGHRIIFININKPSNRYDDVLPVLLQIKSWLLKNESTTENILFSKNYLVHPADFQ
jgi:hypothetical protein